MRTGYNYIINGKMIPQQSRKLVNELISQLTEKPKVLKVEYYENGRARVSVIEVKQGKNGFTIT